MTAPKENSARRSYVKRRLSITAYQWWSLDLSDPSRDVTHFRNPATVGDYKCPVCERSIKAHGWIDTLEGGHRVCPGDYIITGIAGEKYPCKPDIFADTYTEAGDDKGGE